MTLLPILSIILLSINALMGVAFNSSVLGYQSAAVSQYSAQQFLLSEYVLSQAEQWLQHTPVTQLPAPVSNCSQSPCILQAHAAAYLPQQSPSWWQDANNHAVKQVNMNIPFSHNAFYAIEQLMESGTTHERYYRITAWALLTAQTVPTILQSVWVKSTQLPNRSISWREW